MMKNFTKITLIIGGIFLCSDVSSQCVINALSERDTLVCGECNTLSAYGYVPGNIAFEETFNSGSPVGWQFTQSVTIANNTCGNPSPDGSKFMWMGNASVNPRDMTTVNFDLSLGGVVCFEMRYAAQGGATPCEGPDLPSEGVYVQYSINNGSTWKTIEYYDPLGGRNSKLTNWNNYCFTLPNGAMTTKTMIRWHQDAVSGPQYDHWGIDNVVITLNDPTYKIVWEHDNYDYGYGSGGGINPMPVCPKTTTRYVANITNGTITCRDTIKVPVVNPQILVDAGLDQIVCKDSCVTLASTAKVIMRHAKTPTYSDKQSDTAAVGSFFGIKDTMTLSLNVANLNMNSLQNGSIASVCIEKVRADGIVYASDIKFELICPDGAKIDLMPRDTLLKGSSFLTYVTLFDSICFEPTGPAVNTGTKPYKSNFGTSESFDNLSGCTANGIWQLRVIYSASFFGTGNLVVSNWSITFNDPEITAPPDFVWNPTVSMLPPISITPTLCPVLKSMEYELFVTDTAKCVSNFDNVIVEIGSCCILKFDSVQTSEPTCGLSDGTLIVFLADTVGTITYSLDSGKTTQTSRVFNLLPAGSYIITVNDDNNCAVHFPVNLSNSGAPSIDSIDVTHTSCSENNGMLSIYASGGNSPYKYSIDGGVNFVDTFMFDTLKDGEYTVMVKDLTLCTKVQQVTLKTSSALTVTDVITTDPTCGLFNGKIHINSTGSGMTYSIDSGKTFQLSPDFEILKSGVYTIDIKDLNNCTVTLQDTLYPSLGPVIDSIKLTDVSCDKANGSIEVFASGTGLTYSADSGNTYVSSGLFTNQNQGLHYITVKDGNGCTIPQQVVLESSSNLSILSVVTTSSTCGKDNGKITITASGSAAYSIDSGKTYVPSFTFDDLKSGKYFATIKDNGGCEIVQETEVKQIAPPTITGLTVDSTDCNDNIGRIQVNATGSGLQYSINGGNLQPVAEFKGLDSGSYTILVKDANSCEVSQTTNVFSHGVPTITNIITSNADCGFKNGQVEIFANGSNLQYEINTIATAPVAGTFTGIASGIYKITVYSGLCKDSTIATVNENGIAAAFTATPITGDAPLDVTFTNEGVAVVSHVWDFGDGITSVLTDTSHTYEKEGTYTVMLISTSSGGCLDTATATIYVIDPEVKLVIPNVFSPNGDNANETFRVTSQGIETFKVTIFNRWGKLLFESNEATFAWDGKNNGKDVPDGTYYYTITASGKGKSLNESGAVTLLRSNVN